MRHGIQSTQLLQSIFSDLAEANPGADMNDIIASIPAAIEEVLPNSIYNVKTAPIQLSDVEIRFRELRNNRKQEYIKNELKELGADPEVILIDAKSVMNQWSNIDSPVGIQLGFSPNISTQRPFYSEITRSGKSVVDTKFLDTMKKARSVVAQRHVLLEDSDSIPYDSEKLDPTQSILNLPKPLQQIKSRQTEHQLLSLHDMIDVNQVMKNTITKEQELNAILVLLKTDMDTRNEKFNQDCMAKLYENQNLLPKGRRIVKPQKRDKYMRIKEMIQAITLDEYEKERRKLSSDFLTKKIDYETYQNSVKTLAQTTDSTWQK